MNEKINKFFLYSLIFLSLHSSIGALVYKFYQLNTLGVFLNLILSILLFIIILSLKKKYQKNDNIIFLDSELPTVDNYFKKKFSIKPQSLFLFFSYIIFYLLCLYLLIARSSTMAIPSPWAVLPGYFFIFFIILCLILIVNIYKNSKFALILLSLHYFLVFSIGILVYKIGFGFDPFIHNATLDYIKAHGEALPKPLYYLGYYPIIITLNKLSFIPISAINKFLVPVLSSVFLPFVFYKLTKNWFKDKKASLLTVFFLLILPFSFFTISTPQSLAYFFLLVAIVSSVMAISFFDIFLVLLFSLATFLIHPVAGIPAFFLSCSILTLRLQSKTIKKYLFLLILFLNTISLPLAFYFVNHQNGSEVFKIDKNSFSLEKATTFFKVFSAGEESIILNLTYFVIFNYKFFLLLLLALGIFLIFKYKTQCSRLFVHLSLSASLFVSFLLTKTLPFDWLISYEQNNYSQRILLDALLFLLPLFVVAIHALIIKSSNQKKAVKLIFVFSIVFFMTMVLYMNYPRKDNYHNTRSFPVSLTDINTVNWIEEKSEGRDYVVLANQQVSAAALESFGFKKYYQAPDDSKEPIFFYPIPTGGKMYQLYLNMVYQKPSRETALKAMDLAQVDLLYFVLNDYWWAFPKILGEAKVEANSFHPINDGKNYIFLYSR